MSGGPGQGARVADNRVELTTARGAFQADYVICGTGVRMDPALIPALGDCADNIALRVDRYTPPAEEASERLGELPYLAPDYAFVEKRVGETPWIRDIHLFGIGTTMSFDHGRTALGGRRDARPVRS